MRLKTQKRNTPKDEARHWTTGAEILTERSSQTRSAIMLSSEGSKEDRMTRFMKMHQDMASRLQSN